MRVSCFSRDIMWVLFGATMWTCRRRRLSAGVRWWPSLCVYCCNNKIFLFNPFLFVPFVSFIFAQLWVMWLSSIVVRTHTQAICCSGGGAGGGGGPRGSCWYSSTVDTTFTASAGSAGRMHTHDIPCGCDKLNCESAVVAMWGGSIDA